MRARLMAAWLSRGDSPPSSGISLFTIVQSNILTRCVVTGKGDADWGLAQGKLFPPPA